MSSSQRPEPPPTHPSRFCPGEGAAAAPISQPSVAILAKHMLRDGELVLLILRPSRWFILLSSLKFLAAIAILTTAGLILTDDRYLRQSLAQVAAFLMAGRLMWAILQWMGRLYILTDLRIVRLSGVFSIEVFDCPLRRVARTFLEITLKERLCRIGSITIIPQDEELPLGTWQMVARPRQVHEQIQATIARAKQGGQPS